MSGRPWRVVALDEAGEVAANFGYVHEQWQARNLQRTFADRGAVVQHQEPPTIHPWVTQEPSA